MLLQNYIQYPALLLALPALAANNIRLGWIFCRLDLPYAQTIIIHHCEQLKQLSWVITGRQEVSFCPVMRGRVFSIQIS